VRGPDEVAGGDRRCSDNRRLRRTTVLLVAVALLGLASLPFAQGTAPPSPLTMVSRDGRRPVATTVVGGQELIGLDDIATLFGVSVREDTLTRGITVTYRGRTIVASADQPMASVNGRVVTLPSPAVRSGRRWLVPLDFLPRALAPIFDQPIDLRRPSRLLIVGDVRVPLVTARIDTAGPPTRATIEIAPAATASVVAAEAGRVLIRVEADALDLRLPTGGGGLLDAIRGGDAPNTIAAMLAAAAGVPRVGVVTADNVTRVTIDVAAASAPPAPAGTDTANRPPAPAATPSEGTLPATPRTGFGTVVIDAGHGGEETGVRGPGGLLEKDLTLDVARRLRALIESRLGLRVILTREDDRNIGLDARAAIANNSKADLFLSLHANAALAPELAGVEVYHLKLDREGEAARREAAADSVMLPVLGGRVRSLDVIRWDLAQARHIDESAMFATFLGDEIGKQVALGARPVRQAPLRVLEGADMPAALVEMLYLTNPEQEKLAATDAHKGLLAQGLYDAVVRFRGFIDGQRAR